MRCGHVVQRVELTNGAAIWNMCNVVYEDCIRIIKNVGAFQPNGVALHVVAKTRKVVHPDDCITSSIYRGKVSSRGPRKILDVALTKNL